MHAKAPIVAVMLVLCALPAAAQLQSKHQIRCLQELWKSSVQVSKAQGNECGACAKFAAQGRLAPMTSEECMYADLNAKVAKQQQRTVTVAGEKCAVEWPTYGATSPVTVNALSAQAQIDLAIDLFGPDLDAGLVECGSDSAACGCQVKTVKAATGLASTVLAEFGACAKRAIKINKQPFLSGVVSPEELERCLYDATIPWSVASDDRGKVAKAAGKISDSLAKCGDPAGLFPGACSAATGAGLVDCIAARASCRSCLAINGMFDLVVDCDAYDDGAANTSCN